jgi:hypothetical protein
VLAGEHPRGIAAKAGLRDGVVELYERLFFDVRDRLGAPDFIMSQVVGPKAYMGLNAQDLDVLWKLLGYVHGPDALDAAIPLGEGVFSTDVSEPVLKSQSRSKVQLRLDVLVRMEPTVPVLRAIRRLQEQLRRRQGGRRKSG